MRIKQRLSVVFVKIKFEIGELKNYSLGAVWRAKAVDFLGSGLWLILEVCGKSKMNTVKTI